MKKMKYCFTANKCNVKAENNFWYVKVVELSISLHPGEIWIQFLCTAIERAEDEVTIFKMEWIWSKHRWHHILTLINTVILFVQLYLNQFSHPESNPFVTWKHNRYGKFVKLTFPVGNVTSQSNSRSKQ